MKLSMKRAVQATGAVVAALAVVATLAALTSRHYADKAYLAGVSRHQSYLLADELRQSSDDLTRLARTFVVSGGEPRWEQQYFEILDIRNGVKPRPMAYERVYWDFRAVDGEVPGRGEAVALLALMKQQGFSGAELAKLEEAKANSDDLVNTETLAMNLVKGLHRDAQGAYTVKGPQDPAKARELMHDMAYHQYKAKIMRPVNEFLALLDERTARDLAEARAAQALWSSVAVGTVCLLGLACGAGLLLVRRKSDEIVVAFTQAAVHIADGDLASPVRQDMAGDEGLALAQLGNMKSALRQLVTDVHRCAEEVSGASAQISQGNHDLSVRTERQAAELQETAATMDQLATNVRANATNADDASQVARRASEVAVRGGEAVGQVVRTIGEISDASREIAEISSVIDGIAFQTNLLALNAAVEAARAGSQGRGFAVVAGEVRTLAGRSAEAAKQIKQLINASAGRISHGVTLADGAGSTMRNIVDEIGHVDRLMSTIASASQEQSRGVQQVGQAVSQIDSVTQQNAALVEQAAAASESLRRQAAVLVSSVSRFRVA